MTYEELCWEPIAALPEGEPETSFGGRWEHRLWLNVPGPFYTGIADNCWTGRLHAPGHVLYGGEYFGEYVYRQPTTTAEVLNVVTAAQEDPYRGYACDGDSRWTPEGVRDWWRDRVRVTEYLESLLPGWSVATLKSWRILRKLRCSTTRITSLVQAVLTLRLASSE